MKRIATAVILILLVCILIFLGKPWMLMLVAALFAGLAAYEYVKLAEAQGYRIPLWWIFPAIALLFLVILNTSVPRDVMLPMLSGLGLLLFTWAALRQPLDRVLPDAAAGIFALFYIAYPLTLLPLMRAMWDGAALLLFLLVAVWAGDIAALYIGKNFGKRKLAPRLSPNKTWEGSIASIVGSVLAALGVALLGDYLATKDIPVLHISEPLWQTLLLAAIVNIAAQLGDLLESAIKRGAGVKDSGTLLPGHGGILDRIDALLVAAPVLWYCLLIKDYFGWGQF